MLYEAVLVFANSDILVNLLTQNGLFLYFLSCKLLKIFISAPPFPKIDGFENLALKIDGFDRTHRTRSDATTDIVGIFFKNTNTVNYCCAL